jgi:hypothetical protein
MTQPSPRERIHRVPFGQGSFVLGGMLVRPEQRPADGLVPPATASGPLWDLLSAHGFPNGVAGADAVAARVAWLTATQRVRLDKLFAQTGAPALSQKDRRVLWSIFNAVVPGLGDRFEAALEAQTTLDWAERSCHPNFLARAGDPPESFCLVPDPAGLATLARNWPERDPTLAAHLQEAIAEAALRVGRGEPWLNRWQGARPTGLWLWNWREISGITPFNGGEMSTTYIWAVMQADRALPSIRYSRSPPVHTPCGLLLSQPSCSFTYVERSWDPAGERDVAILEGIDLQQPLRPVLRRRTASPKP